MSISTILIAILVLAVLIFIHELGHFMGARWAGVRVNQFSIGFPPFVFKKTVGETEYAIGAIPLGGFVRLEGENPEDENANDPANYASKGAWKKFVILVAGPLMNLILAMAVIPFVFMMAGERPAFLSQPAQILRVEPGSLAEQAQLRAGDIIVKVENVETPTWSDVLTQMTPRTVSQERTTLIVQRNQMGVPITIPPTGMKIKDFGWVQWEEPVVGTVLSGSAAQKAGLKPGDRVVSINGKDVNNWEDVVTQVRVNQGNTMAFTLLRGGSQLTIPVNPAQDRDGKFRVGISSIITESYGFGEAVVRGESLLLDISAQMFEFLGRLFTGGASLGEVVGPVGIFQAIGSTAERGFAPLIMLVALISLNLGLLNLLPFPPLDGGRILIVAVEKIRGAALPIDFKLRMQIGGFLLLMLLMVLVTIRELTH
ncbi:MAG: RIP metalloprotease RseP [Deltaproteobacteria bacterium]|nr:RIP metalloprotease RseP [Deltaproteobacteria bacterium]